MDNVLKERIDTMLPCSMNGSEDYSWQARQKPSVLTE
jgi:hypothetical protein